MGVRRFDSAERRWQVGRCGEVRRGWITEVTIGEEEEEFELDVLLNRKLVELLGDGGEVNWE